MEPSAGGEQVAGRLYGLELARHGLVPEGLGREAGDLGGAGKTDPLIWWL